MLQECKFANFEGRIFIEPYEDHEEEDRCKIYDEYEGYIDYIPIEFLSKDEYNLYVSQLLTTNTIGNFIKRLKYRNCLRSKDRYGLMCALYKDDFEREDVDLYSKAIIDELRDDDENLSDRQFCEKYMLNKIGDTYFYLGDF